MTSELLENIKYLVSNFLQILDLLIKDGTSDILIILR